MGIAVVLEGNLSNKTFPPLFPECPLNRLRALVVSDDLKWNKTRDQFHNLEFGNPHYSLRWWNIPARTGVCLIPVIVETLRKSLGIYGVKSAQVHL